MTDYLTKYRAILARSDEWDKKTAALDKLPAAKLAKAIKDVEAATAAWPAQLQSWFSRDEAEMRLSPLSWVKEIYEGKPSEKHSVIRILRSPRKPLKDQKLENLLLPKQKLTNVKEVQLQQMPITATLLKKCKGKGIWQRWESLHIWYCDIKPATLKVLVQVDMPAMKRLNLAQNRFGAEGAAALKGASHWGAIEEINLSNNAIGDDGAKALVGAPWLKQLKGINLSLNALTSDGLASLAGLMPALSWLTLGDDESCASPAKWAKGFSSLTSLALGETELTDAGFSQILQAMPSLSRLELASNLSDKSASALASSGHKFTELHLANNSFSGAAIEALLKSPAAQQVQLLTLPSSGITAKTAKLLIDGFPLLEQLAWFGDGAEERAEKLLETKLKPKIPHVNQ